MSSDLAVERTAVEILGAAAADAQRRAASRRAARMRALQRFERRRRISRPARRELVAIQDARLVGLDDLRLRQRGGFPFAHERMREQRREVLAGGARRAARRTSGSGTRPARRTRRRARTRRTGTRPPCPKRRRDSVQISSTRAMFGAERVRPRPHVDALADAHRHLVAQRAEAGVHLGGDRARPRARRRVGRPHAADGARPGTRRSRANPTPATSPSCSAGTSAVGENERLSGLYVPRSWIMHFRGTARRRAWSRASRAATTTSSSCCRCRACTWRSEPGQAEPSCRGS